MKYDYIIKPNRIIVRGDERTVIPSKLYPVGSEYILLTSDNTEDFDLSNPEHQKIVEIFDNYNVKVGRCYTNTQNISELFSKNNIEHKVMGGWLFTHPTLAPVHHAFIMIDKHVIDCGAALTEKTYLEASQSSDPQRFIAELQLANIPNHKKYCFGKIDSMYLYIASESSVEDSRALINEVREVYPQHPAYVDMRLDEHGSTPIQDMVRAKEK